MAEQVDACGADGLDFILFAFLFVQRPRRLVGDPGVGAVGQAHDLAHGTGKVAGFIGVGDTWRGGQEGFGQFRRGVGVDHYAGIALVDETGTTAGDVDDLAHQVGIDLLHEVFEVQIEVINATAQLGRVVIAQVFRRQVVQVGPGLDEGAAGLGHFLTVDSQVAVHVDAGRLAVARALEHGWPEQGVEVDDVLADEVVQLGGGVLAPERVEVQLRRAVAQVLEAGHVTDRCIQPHVEVLARLVGDFKTEIRCIAGDVPLLQAGIQPFGDLVGDGILQGAAAGPGLQHLLEVWQLEEEVLGILEHRCGAGDRRLRILQVGRCVGRTAFFAVVAVLVFGAAFRAGALDEAVGQEHFLFRVEVLGDRTRGDVPGVTQLQVDLARQLTVFFGVSGVEIVEVHQEVGKVGAVFSLDVGDQLFRGDAFLFRAQHDRRTVGVVGADIDALIAAVLLEAHPHIGLDVFQHMAEVNRTIGIGQGAGDEDLAWLGHGARLLDETEVGHYKAPAHIFHPVSLFPDA
ncbi:hypothetical protein PS647_02842 [Pseudomonas fluorescens]|nr:hypothetical protein PS647_02842 [Pseudomonas fluorescens]